jgi:hypothetical protein
MTIGFSVKCSNNCDCDKFYFLKNPVKSTDSSRKTNIVCGNLFFNNPSNQNRKQLPIERRFIVDTCGNFCKCANVHQVSKVVNERLIGPITLCCEKRKGHYLGKQVKPEEAKETGTLGDNGKAIGHFDCADSNIFGGTIYTE